MQAKLLPSNSISKAVLKLKTSFNTAFAFAVDAAVFLFMVKLHFGFA